MTRLEGIFILMCASVLSGCATYTKIDSKNWIDFEERHGDRAISYSVPDGFVAGEISGWKDTVAIRSFQYDVLRSPYIYGTPWGETSISLFVCDSVGPLESVAMGIPTAKSPPPLPSEHGIFLKDWYLTVFENEAEGWMTRFYVTRLTEGRYLLVRAGLRSAVYRRSSLRAQRIQLAEDVVRTFQINERRQHD